MRWEVSHGSFGGFAEKQQLYSGIVYLAIEAWGDEVIKLSKIFGTGLFLLN